MRKIHITTILQGNTMFTKKYTAGNFFTQPLVATFVTNWVAGGFGYLTDS